MGEGWDHTVGQEEAGKGLPRLKARGESHGEKEAVSLGGLIRLAWCALRHDTISTNSVSIKGRPHSPGGPNDDMYGPSRHVALLSPNSSKMRALSSSVSDNY